MEAWLTDVIALLAILNPVGSLPIFAGVSAPLDPPTRRRLFDLCTLTGLATLLVLTLAGQWIMERVFGIQIAEFKVAGGVLLTVIGVKSIAFPDRGLLRPSTPDGALELGVVPLAVPLLVGPGAIVTGILILNRDGPVTAVTSIVAAFAVTRLLLQGAPLVDRVVGHLGGLVLSRVLDIFITAIGVSFLASGARELFGP